MLKDALMIEGLENGTLPPEQFNHEGHLRLGWLMLKQYPLEEAVQRACWLIRRYAGHLGAADKFHATLSMASMMILAERMSSEDACFDDFIQREPAMLNQLPTLIATHYSHACMAHAKAKACFCAPDLKPFRLPIAGVLACTP